MKDCENCTEWKYLEGWNVYYCWSRSTLAPLNAEKCEFYNPIRKDTLLDKLRRLKNE